MLELENIGYEFSDVANGVWVRVDTEEMEFCFLSRFHTFDHTFKDYDLKSFIDYLTQVNKKIDAHQQKS